MCLQHNKKYNTLGYHFSYDSFVSFPLTFLSECKLLPTLSHYSDTMLYNNVIVGNTFPKVKNVLS
jgi:hypothetical protein